MRSNSPDTLGVPPRSHVPPNALGAGRIAAVRDHAVFLVIRFFSVCVRTSIDAFRTRRMRRVCLLVRTFHRAPPAATVGDDPNRSRSELW
jgi:hypothetical protein